jgi:hypothetical protein
VSMRTAVRSGQRPGLGLGRKEYKHPEERRSATGPMPHPLAQGVSGRLLDGSERFEKYVIVV